ncbi:MAG: hypothetical protein H0V72_05285 [Bradyrhizobium sp.]|nr:hypothetical protein [Bradyrhizobium sp.]
MKLRFSIVVSATLLAASILLLFNGRLDARGPHHPLTECGFWGPMEAGISCQ